MTRRAFFREAWPVALGLGAVTLGYQIGASQRDGERDGVQGQIAELDRQVRAANLGVADLTRNRSDLATTLAVIEDLWRTMQALQQRVGKLEAKVR